MGYLREQMLLDFVCWLKWLKRKTSSGSTERMCHAFWAEAVGGETGTPEQKGRWDLLQGQQASWLVGAWEGAAYGHQALLHVRTQQDRHDSIAAQANLLNHQLGGLETQ